ncbi:hypothetical protein AMJ80_05600 [bacterium SM23_31]|nr:MAG: hypothetical protein AMJ80_05600 [bacterium SM23_31]
MVKFFHEGGPFTFLLLLLAIVVVVLSVKKTVELFIQNRDPLSPGMENGINAILFWSGIMVVIPFLITFWALNVASKGMSMANDISPPLIWEGIHNVLIPIIFSLTFFTFAAIVWFILRVRYKKLLEKSM